MKLILFTFLISISSAFAAEPPTNSAIINYHVRCVVADSSRSKDDLNRVRYHSEINFNGQDRQQLRSVSTPLDYTVNILTTRSANLKLDGDGAKPFPSYFVDIRISHPKDKNYIDKNIRFHLTYPSLDAFTFVWEPLNLVVICGTTRDKV